MFLDETHQFLRPTPTSCWGFPLLTYPSARAESQCTISCTEGRTLDAGGGLKPASSCAAVCRGLAEMGETQGEMRCFVLGGERERERERESLLSFCVCVCVCVFFFGGAPTF